MKVVTSRMMTTLKYKSRNDMTQDMAVESGLTEFVVVAEVATFADRRLKDAGLTASATSS